jgi:hypothetical protein
MCQMCDEYEHELVRMGLIEDAKKFREERQREHEAEVVAARPSRQDKIGLKKIAPKRRMH